MTLNNGTNAEVSYIFMHIQQIVTISFVHWQIQLSSSGISNTDMYMYIGSIGEFVTDCILFVRLIMSQFDLKKSN